MRIVRALAALAAQPRGGTRRLLTLRFASNNAVADAEVLAARAAAKKAADDVAEAKREGSVAHALVRLNGLQQRAELNGVLGTMCNASKIGSAVADNERFGVLLEGASTPMALKLANLLFEKPRSMRPERATTSEGTSIDWPTKIRSLRDRGMNFSKHSPGIGLF